MEVYRALMHGRPRLRPWEIERMTPCEIALALEQDLEKPSSYGQGQALKSAAEVEEYVKWWRGLSVLERIRHAREEGG